VLVITPANRRGLFVALLPGRIISRSRQPFVDGAHQLLRESFPPETLLISRGAPDGMDCLRSTIGFAAGITIDEHNGTALARYKPFSSSAVASLMRFCKSAATTLAERIEPPAGAAVDEPDPPDTRRRPRTGNAKAPA
jgi:hypothetical protein